MLNKIHKKINTLFRRIAVMQNWYRFIWPLNRIGSWPRTAKLRSGARIVIPALYSSTSAIFNEIAIDDAYEIYKLENLPLILDIGANVGVFSILVAKLYPYATVIAYEPEKDNFEKLKNNIRLSNASNVTAINKAVARTTGTASLYMHPGNIGAHSLFGSGSAQEIKTIAFSEILPANAIKIDAEGAEYEVFKDVVPDCARIMMETHQGDDVALFAKLSEKYNVSTRGAIHILTHK